MAGVSLRDLMNPLTKIEQYTKDTRDQLNELTDLLVNGVSPQSTSVRGKNVNSQGGGDPIQMAVLTELQTQTQYLREISKKRGGLSSLFGNNSDKKGFNTSGIDALQKLGLGAQDLAKAMIMFRFIPKKIVNSFATSIETIFVSLSRVDTAKAEKGARLLAGLGGSLIKFSGALALSALLLIPGMFAIPFLLVGITAIGGMMALLGKFEKPIDKGSSALMYMGTALGFFAIGYTIFALSAKLTSIEEIPKQSLIIGGIGLAFALVGKFASNVLKGAIAFGLMGVALIPFALGYAMFAGVTKDIGYEDIGKQALALTAVGTVFAVAGLASGFIALGALAFGLAGIGLIGLSYGLGKFMELGWKESDSDTLATALGSIRLAFTGGDASDSFLGKVGNMFMGAVDSAAMIAASGGFIAAGISLIGLSKGLQTFKGIKWTEGDSKVLGVTLGGITAAFAQAGGEPSNPGGMFGLVFGNTFSSNAVGRGISSTMDAGEALSGIAKGLLAFQNLITSGVKFGSPDADGNFEEGTLGFAVVNTVGFVSQAFAAIANEGNVQGGGFFDTLFQTKRNKVQEGIMSVKNVGEELVNIATGLDKFKGLKNPTDLAEKIKSTITFVGSAFASIADQKTEKSALFGLISWDTNKVQEGISNVKGAGEELLNISQSLVNFEGLKNPAGLAQSIGGLFTSISNVFVEIGNNSTNSKSMPVMAQFSDFINIVGERAADGDIDKAAKDIQKVSKAINSLDIEKTETLTELFKSTANLTENRGDAALRALAEAVEDIRDILSKSNGNSNNTQVQTQPAPPQTIERTSKEPSISQELLARLESTLANINTTMSNLPGDIATIEIKIPQN